MEPDVPASTVYVPASQRVHNPQFDLADGERLPCRVLIQGSHTYVSPRWYPSIQPAEHGGVARGRAEGRAVGTWDYEQVQIAGWLTVHRDTRRLRGEVMAQARSVDAARLADTPGAADAERGPWSGAEAPSEFMAAMLQGIVGVELEITEVVGRFKLSRNRTDADLLGHGPLLGLVEVGFDLVRVGLDHVRLVPQPATGQGETVRGRTCRGR